MNPVNITRDEARTRSAALSVESYRISLDLTGHDADGRALADPDETFSSVSTVRFASDGSDTWIDIIADDVTRIELDGSPLDPQLFADCRIPLSAPAGSHDLSVTAICRYSHTGEGLHRFVDPADGRVYLYSQFESADARRAYACFEQPDLKASFEFTVRAPREWIVVSNSPEPAPAAQGGTSIWHFEPTPRISTYITAIIAGEYHVERGTVASAKGVLGASLVCRQSVVPHLDSARIRSTTQAGFGVYEQAFGRPYPFAKYDQLFVPEYNAGAMENAGAVTIRDEYLFRSQVTSADLEQRDNTILHELAHMWFGDLVTMRWWDDLWLNESFAEWCSHYAQQKIAEHDGGADPWVGFANARKGWAYIQDQLPTTHPIAADMVDLEAVEQNFDGITYAKGASVLKQLVAFVGEQNFLAGVREYLSEHAFGNAEFADLLDALQKASGRDLSQFAAQWLQTSGVNTLRANAEVDDAGVLRRYEITQSAPADHPTLRTHHLAIGLGTLVDGKLAIAESFEVEIDGEHTEIDALAGRPRPDLILLNHRDLGFAKIRLDEHSLATALAHIADLPDALARALVWSMAWDMARDAQLSAADYIDLVLRGAGSETDMTGVRTSLRRALSCATAYTAPAGREELRSRLTDGLWGLLDAAAAGSQHQLALADALVATAARPQDAQRLARWLDGEAVPAGLVIDQDRRWEVLTTLARIGVIDETRIDAERGRDRTITGAERAAGAKSALADPQAKARAWQLATEDPSVPNATHRTICANFVHYGQESLLEPYVERYLQVCELISSHEGIWATRGTAAREAVLNMLWPAPLADRSLLDRLDGWAAKADLSAPVRRAVSEHRDQTLRALAAQEFGAEGH
ncbi:aminopeptidase N [Propionibacterium cyclohexanicum]|uniref:Aminopeptidase N n=2 Tax=Propionibacterium cyclohexanicum TaxID=64702 RepID=A0A1H9SCA6_9ACTN|nr:aminopeptidase N [Propionibacterium cyclohexanicum]SER82617.1 aminopeptidase N [Propionibacterium cyclohexanicum]